MSTREQTGSTAAPGATMAAAAENEKPGFVVTASRLFPSWLANTGASLAISTYQSSKVILIGANKHAGRLLVIERTLERTMGMAFDGSRRAIASMIQITSFVDAARGTPATTHSLFRNQLPIQRTSTFMTSPSTPTANWSSPIPCSPAWRPPRRPTASNPCGSRLSCRGWRRRTAVI